MTTFFKPGPGVGIIGQTTLGLFDPMNAELAVRLWDLVDEGVGVDDLLEVLSTQGLRTLGSFVLAQFEGAEIRLVVRGTASAANQVGTARQEITAGGARTWFESVLAGSDALTLRLGGVEDEVPPTRVLAGLVPAVVLARGARVRVAEWATALDWDAVDAELGLLPGPQTVKSSPVLASQPPVEHDPASAPFSQRPPVDTGLTLSVSDFLAAENGDQEASRALVPPDESGPEAAADDEPALNEFDDIWGRTVARSVQNAAVHVPEDVVADGGSSEATNAPTASFASSPMTGTPAGQAPPIIEGIPGAASAAAGDHDGRTMTKAQLAAMRAARDGASAPVAAVPVQPVGPAVQAILCTAGHANPPHASVCRLCGSQLSGAPVLVARPVLATLRFADGTMLPLDRPTLIGRSPKVEGSVYAELPKLHALDVGQGLSRTHALVRLEGWQVLLEDLNSANGTIVTLPGREPRRLHPGEPVLLEVGASIDFGGEVSCSVTA